MTDKPTSVPIELVRELRDALAANAETPEDSELIAKATAYLRELDAAHPVATPQAEYPVVGGAAACQFRWKFADGGWSSWTKVASQDEAERLCRSHAVRGIEAEYRALYDRPLPTPSAQPADNAAGVQGSVSEEDVVEVSRVFVRNCRMWHHLDAEQLHAALRVAIQTDRARVAKRIAAQKGGDHG